MSLSVQHGVRIVFAVKSYDRCRGFYEGPLALRPMDEWDRGPGDRGVVYELGALHLELIEAPRDPLADGVYVYVPVADVDALWARLAGAVEVADPIATQPWGHRNFAVRDPAGVKLKFFSVVEEGHGG